MKLSAAERALVADLVTSAEIARRRGVVRGAVSNWIATYPDFPEPIVIPVGAHLYRWSEVLAWCISMWGAGEGRDHTRYRRNQEASQ